MMTTKHTRRRKRRRIIPQIKVTAFFILVLLGNSLPVVKAKHTAGTACFSNVAARRRRHPTTTISSSSSSDRHGNRNKASSIIRTDRDSSMDEEWGLQETYGMTAAALNHDNENDIISNSGLNRRPNSYCPTDVSDVVDDCFDVIAGTLLGMSQPDPNIALAYSPSLWKTRPLRSPPQDGRIGIEIDSAHLLFQHQRDHQRPLRSETRNENDRGMWKEGEDHHNKPIMHEGRALRRLALLLATKLAMNESWSQIEGLERRKPEGTKAIDKSGTRPVVLVFNTRKEALLAALEQKHLLRNNNAVKDDIERQALSTAVEVQCMDDDFPQILITTMTNSSSTPITSSSRKEKSSKTKSSSRKQQNPQYLDKTMLKNSVDPTKGLMLIVQPTDFTYELLPPSPTPYTLRNLQRYIACSYLEKIPVVVMSPRFVFDSVRGQYSSSDSSMAFQRADYFGGKEPARGMPWIMRDFFPPSYVWVGDALNGGDDGEDSEDMTSPQQRRRRVRRRTRQRPSSSLSHPAALVANFHDVDGFFDDDFQLTLTHSVMDKVRI